MNRCPNCLYTYKNKKKMFNYIINPEIWIWNETHTHTHTHTHTQNLKVIAMVEVPMDCGLPGSSSGYFPGKHTGVGWHFLLQGICIVMKEL